MVFPLGWPPRPATQRRSIRFFATGTGTANFSDNAFLFNNVNSAYAVIGQTLNGRVLASVTATGQAGNAFSIQVVIPTSGGPSALSATLVQQTVIVSLATDASNFPIAASNTATLVAAAIAGVAGFAAVATGTGADSLQFNEGPTPFFGGGGMPVFPTPFVPPGGATTQARVGIPQIASGSPMGIGSSPRDADLGAAMLAQAEPVPMAWSYAMRISNLGATNPIDFSFDGINVHGTISVSSDHVYWDRIESGIALRGVSAFRIEAW